VNAFDRKILRWTYSPIKDDKGWRIRYNNKNYDLYKEIKVAKFIKFRRLQWAEHVIRRVEHRTPKRALQQTIHSNRRVGKPRKRWEGGVREDAVALCGTWALKTKAKNTENPGCNDLSRPRLNLGCITTAAVAAAHITQVIHVPVHMTSL
jgi:hypothetical protein